MIGYFFLNKILIFFKKRPIKDDERRICEAWVEEIKDVKNIKK